MVLRTATEEKVDDGAVKGVVAPIPATRPANHVKGVIVAVSHDIASRVGEAPDDLQVPGCRGPVHRVRVVAFLAGVDVQAASEQQVHDFQTAGKRRQVQQRLFVRLGSQVERVGILIQERNQGSDVACAGRLDHAVVHG